MQFIVLIEFLIPGAATVLLGFALFPDALPRLPQALLAGDTATALLLLVISYPVGHMVNYPIFVLLQRRVLTPMVRRKTVHSFWKTGVDLVKLVNQRLGVKISSNRTELTEADFEKMKTKSISEAELWHLFGYMRAMALSGDADYLNAHVFFYKSLQRLARGMLIPLVLTIAFVVDRKGLTFLSLMLSLILCLVIVVCLHLLEYSLQAEEDEIARFFVASIQDKPAIPTSVG